MKKAANVLYTVGYVLCIVTAVCLLSPTPVLIVLGFSHSINKSIVEAVEQYAPASLAEHAQLFATLLQAGFILTSILFVLVGLACVVNAIVTQRAKKEQTHGLYIATIVLGAFTVNITVLAGIFSLISEKNEDPEE